MVGSEANINEEGSKMSYVLVRWRSIGRGHHRISGREGSWSPSFTYSGLDSDAGSLPQLPLGSCSRPGLSKGTDFQNDQEPEIGLLPPLIHLPRPRSSWC